MSEQSLRVLLRSSDIINKVPSNSGVLREGDSAANGRQGSELGVVHLVEAKQDGSPELKNSSAGLYFKVGTTLEIGSDNKVVRVGPVYVTTDGVRPDERELNNSDIDYTGALWYRGDSKDLYINYTGEKNPEAWELLSAYYTNETPTPFELGGIAQGTTFDETSFEELVTQLLYPEAVLNAANLLLDPDPVGLDEEELLVEVGHSIPTPGGANLITISIEPGPYHRITNVSYIGGTNLQNPLVAENAFLEGNYSGLGANRLFTYTQDNPITFNLPTTYFWGSRLTIGSGKVIEGPRRYIRWRYKTFVTYSEDPDLQDATDSELYSLSRITEWSKPEVEDPSYLYIFLPIGRVVADALIEDGFAEYTSVNMVDGYGIAMTTLSSVDLVRNGVTVRYLRYRTTYQTAYALDIVLD